MAARKKQFIEAAVREIHRRTRRKFAPEEKIWIVLEGCTGSKASRSCTAGSLSPQETSAAQSATARPRRGSAHSLLAAGVSGALQSVAVVGGVEDRATSVPSR